MNIVAPPNHHAHHEGFSGVSGYKAAIRFLFGRSGAAERAIELAELTADDRLVDIGCGPGVAVHRAHRIGAEVVGVDPSAEMLRIAKLRWRTADITWRVGTAEAVPVDDRWATVVWSLATVHHWADLEAGFDELRRLLRPGGRFVSIERRITDPFADGTASHGWTEQQAEAFASMCLDHGFNEAHVATHPGEVETVSVVARIPG